VEAHLDRAIDDEAQVHRAVARPTDVVCPDRGSREGNVREDRDAACGRGGLWGVGRGPRDRPTRKACNADTQGTESESSHQWKLPVSHRSGECELDRSMSLVPGQVLWGSCATMRCGAIGEFLPSLGGSNS